MKAGDLVELIEGSYAGQVGMVAKINWQDSELAWIIFDDRFRDHDPEKTSALRPQWWPISSLRVLEHQKDNVYPGFVELLDQLRKEAVNSSSATLIAERILKEWGLDFFPEDISTYFVLLDEDPRQMEVG